MGEPHLRPNPLLQNLNPPTPMNLQVRLERVHGHDNHPPQRRSGARRNRLHAHWQRAVGQQRLDALVRGSVAEAGQGTWDSVRTFGNKSITQEHIGYHVGVLVLTLQQRRPKASVKPGYSTFIIQMFERLP